MPDKGLFCCHHSEPLSTVSSGIKGEYCGLWFLHKCMAMYVYIHVVLYNLLMHSCGFL